MEITLIKLAIIMVLSSTTCAIILREKEPFVEARRDTCQEKTCQQVKDQAKGLFKLALLPDFVTQTLLLLNDLMVEMDKELARTASSMLKYVGPECGKTYEELQGVIKKQKSRTARSSSELSSGIVKLSGNSMLDQKHSSTVESEQGRHNNLGGSTRNWEKEEFPAPSGGSIEGANYEGPKEAESTPWSRNEGESNKEFAIRQDPSAVSHGHITQSRENSRTSQSYEGDKRQSSQGISSSQGYQGVGYQGSTSSQGYTGSGFSHGYQGRTYSQGYEGGVSSQGYEGGSSNLGYQGSTFSHDQEGRTSSQGYGSGVSSQGYGGGTSSQGHNGSSSGKSFHVSSSSHETISAISTHESEKGTCRGVKVDSPFWVPGLDQWCVMNCAQGYCPSTHCMCD